MQERKDSRKILFGEDARKNVLKGAKLMADTVGLSYGPRGTNVLVEKTIGRPLLTRDGVTISREVYSDQPEVNVGMQLLMEASQTTNRVAGDGTTQTVLLTYHLLDLALKKIAAGVNPMDVKKEIMEDSYKIIKELDSLVKPLKKGQLEQVAAVSSGDALLGKLIAEGVEKVGPNGGLITERAPISGVDRTYIDGYFLQSGFSAMTEGKKELENPYVMVTSKSINSKIDAIQLITKVSERAHQDQKLPMVDQQGRPVPLNEPLRIAFFGEIDGDAYNVIIANVNAGLIDATITKTPATGMGEHYMDDLAIYTGGKALKPGDNLSAVTTDYVGRADKVKATTVETTIFGGKGSKKDIERRMAELKDRIKEEPLDSVVEKSRDRLSKLESKIVMFRIGGATDTEKEELEFRIEDAIQASRAASSDGIVTGGGITLLKLSKTAGIGEIFTEALRNTFKRLLNNANLPTEIKTLEALNAPEGHGFNLRKGDELVDLVKEGVLDPYLVVQQVVENSASTAAAAATLGAVVVFKYKDE